jgi:hypothetical protein
MDDERDDRLLGYVPWEPRELAGLLRDVLAVLTTYAAQLPLAIRQCYYLLLRRGYIKGKPFERQLGRVFNRGRRARLILWGAVRDDTTSVFADDWYDGLDHYYAKERERREGYTLNKQVDQRQVIEVHLEARGMGPQVYGITHPYSVEVYPAGGYGHLTGRHELVQRIISRYEKQTVILSLGDFDPDGIAMFEHMRDDVLAFVAADKRPITPLPIIERVALTGEQVNRYQLEHEPYHPKAKNYRGQKWLTHHPEGVVQLEALPPDQLETEVLAAIGQYLDINQFKAAQRREARERRYLLRSLPPPKR